MGCIDIFLLNLEFHIFFLRAFTETVAKELIYEIRSEGQFSPECQCIKIRTLRALCFLHAKMTLLGLWPHTHSSVHGGTCAVAARPAHDREMESTRLQSIAKNISQSASRLQIQNGFALFLAIP